MEWERRCRARVSCIEIAGEKRKADPPSSAFQQHSLHAKRQKVGQTSMRKSPGSGSIGSTKSPGSCESHGSGTSTGTQLKRAQITRLVGAAKQTAGEVRPCIKVRTVPYSKNRQFGAQGTVVGFPMACFILYLSFCRPDILELCALLEEHPGVMQRLPRVCIHVTIVPTAD